MQNKITFAIITVTIAAVVAGISTIVLNDGIQIVSAQPGYPQGSPQANPQGSQGITPPGPPTGPEGTPFGQSHREEAQREGGFGAHIKDTICGYNGCGVIGGLGQYRANDASGIGEKYNPDPDNPFRDVVRSP